VLHQAIEREWVSARVPVDESERADYSGASLRRPDGSSERRGILSFRDKRPINGGSPRIAGS